MNPSFNTTVKALVKEHTAPIILINPYNLRPLYANKSADRLFGKTVYKEIKALFADKGRFEKHIAKALKTRHHHFKIETRFPGLAVARIDTSMIVIDQIKTMLLVFTDITKTALAKSTIKKKRDMLSELNLALVKRIEAETTLRESQNDLLVQHSKMAAMGEMVDTIAHQWKQPLNSLSFYASMLKDDFRDGVIDAAYIDDVGSKMAHQIDHLVSTLNEFRNFYRQDKIKHPFSLQSAVGGVMLLMHDELLKYQIEVTTETSCPCPLFGIENEFKHILINLLNNAKEAFEINGVKERNIAIRLYEDEHAVCMEVEDNAGGIPESLLSRIFEPAFTTKAASDGSGVGLYLCSQIAAKHDATLEADNTGNGARFTLKADKKKQEKARKKAEERS